MKKSFLERIPEFSEKGYLYASYVCGGLLSAVSIFFIVEMFTVPDFGFDVQWNIFKSVWIWPLYVVGIILAIVFWGKFGHWGGQPYDVYEDSNGKKYAKRNDDITENMFGHFIMPLMGHFVIEPLVYACIIYYPVVCVFAIVGAVLPYLLTLVLIGMCAGVFMSRKYVGKVRFHSAILVLGTLIITAVLLISSISMEKSKPWRNMQDGAPAAVEAPADTLGTVL